MTFLLSLVVSAASKSGGVLLVFCYLVAPSVTALLLARNMAGVIAILGGLIMAYWKDWPGNQTIIIFAFTLLSTTWAIRNIVSWLRVKTRA